MEEDNPINDNPDKGHVNLDIVDFIKKFEYLEDEIGEQISDEENGRDI